MSKYLDDKLEEFNEKFKPSETLEGEEYELYESEDIKNFIFETIKELEGKQLEPIDEDKEIEIHVLEGGGSKCLIFNDYRVAGGKCWGGGHRIYEWKCKIKDLVKPLNLKFGTKPTISIDSNAKESVEKMIGSKLYTEKQAREKFRIKPKLCKCRNDEEGAMTVKCINDDFHQCPRCGGLLVVGTKVSVDDITKILKETWKDYYEVTPGYIMHASENKCCEISAKEIHNYLNKGEK